MLHKIYFNRINLDVIGPTPQFYPTVPLNYVKQGEGDFLSSYKLDKAIADTDSAMTSILREYDVQYLSLFSHLCQREDDKYRCKVVLGDELYSFDYGHLTPKSAGVLAQSLLFEPGIM
ncbi:hypothetical protein FJ444_02265 [Aestuariibacter sp. GS-14]|uniref:hypothetical protein n=1 Tax=Aestuariibacter sp. GS-14 TaxID=2590670 RepID=UPI0011299842|nr:hypothetical protein [Aestuariibacter sp. GS-14]TPV62114.1 hypothetical protein FJ444_02265 [Aestuariibacter sp. GS-14]